VITWNERLIEHAGKELAPAPPRRKPVDALVYGVYGLTEEDIRIVEGTA